MWKAQNKPVACLIEFINHREISSKLELNDINVELLVYYKTRCVFCRYIDRMAIPQAMGSFPKNQLVNPVGWGHIELDLFEPFKCRSEVKVRQRWHETRRNLSVDDVVLIHKSSPLKGQY